MRLNGRRIRRRYRKPAKARRLGKQSYDVENWQNGIPCKKAKRPRQRGERQRLQLIVCRLRGVAERPGGAEKRVMARIRFAMAIRFRLGLSKVRDP